MVALTNYRKKIVKRNLINSYSPDSVDLPQKSQFNQYSQRSNKESHDQKVDKQSSSSVANKIAVGMAGMPGLPPTNQQTKAVIRHNSPIYHQLKQVNF